MTVRKEKKQKNKTPPPLKEGGEIKSRSARPSPINKGKGEREKDREKKNPVYPRHSPPHRNPKHLE